MNTDDFCEGINTGRSLLSDPIQHTNGVSNDVSALGPVAIHGDRPGNGIEQIIQPLIGQTY
jgi:hypothetical protein